MEEAEKQMGYEGTLKNLTEKTEKPTVAYDPQKNVYETRSTIALCFVKGFLYIIGFTLFFIPLYNILAAYNGIELVSLKDLLTGISGIISGPLGFVIGHYFKSDSAR